LDEVKETLNISDTSQDSFLTNLINRVTDWIERYCGHRRFLATDYVEELYSGNGTPYLVTKHWPINSVTKIEERDTELREDEWTEIDSEYYHIKEPEKASIYLIGGTWGGTRNVFNEGVNNYRVTYNAGYETIPEDLKLVCIELVKKFYNDRRNSGMRSETLGEYSYTRMGATLKELGLDILLDPFRTPTI